MDIATITVSDFKALFKKDFPFLPEWQSSPNFYNTGEVVYLSTTRLFYKSLENQTYDIPTDSAAWQITDGTTEDYIDDCDIVRAFGEARMNFNGSIWGDDEFSKQAFLYLAAFYLVNDLATASSGGAYNGLVSSRTVGNVSESYAIPASYANDPLASYYAKNGYGAKYISFLYSRTAGAGIMILGGRTLP